MKTKSIVICLILVGFFLAFQIFWVQPGWAQQAALVDEPVYTFDAVPEGTHVDHTFVVKNIGDTPLTILDVLPP